MSSSKKDNSGCLLLGEILVPFLSRPVMLIAGLYLMGFRFQLTAQVVLGALFVCMAFTSGTFERFNILEEVQKCRKSLSPRESSEQ